MVAVKKAAGFLLIGAAAYFLLPIVPGSAGRYLIPAVLVIAGIYLGFFEKSIRSSRAASSVGKAFGAAALIFAVFLAAPRMGGPALEWEPYETGSIESAAQAGQPSMLDFTADWCAYCEDLERGPFSDPKVVKAAEKFRRFQVDGGTMPREKITAAMREHDVRGYPTVIFFDSAGSEVKSARITGYVDSEQMLERINSVR